MRISYESAYGVHTHICQDAHNPDKIPKGAYVIHYPYAWHATHEVKSAAQMGAPPHDPRNVNQDCVDRMWQEAIQLWTTSAWLFDNGIDLVMEQMRTKHHDVFVTKNVT